MEELRRDGWLVALKCLPKEIGWILEGSRSEYDSPSSDKMIGRGKWTCYAQWMGEGYRSHEFFMHKDPFEAVKGVWTKISQANFLAGVTNMKRDRVEPRCPRRGQMRSRA